MTKALRLSLISVFFFPQDTFLSLWRVGKQMMALNKAQTLVCLLVLCLSSLPITELLSLSLSQCLPPVSVCVYPLFPAYSFIIYSGLDKAFKRAEGESNLGPPFFF